jgi:hypothetical protein
MAVTQSGNMRGWINRMLHLREKVEEVAQRLCKVGEPIIQATHGNHARVWSEPTKNGYKVCAEGEDILFIEFGTGLKAGQDAHLYDEVPGVVGEGTWSATHAKMYSTWGFWVFAGEIYYYTEPHPAFYYAYQAMVEALPQIAQEVFSK